MWEIIISSRKSGAFKFPKRSDGELMVDTPHVQRIIFSRAKSAVFQIPRCLSRIRKESFVCTNYQNGDRSLSILR